MQRCESPHGRSAAETRKAQRSGGGARSLGEDVALEALAETTKSFGASVLSAALTVGSHFKGLYTSLAEAAAIREAHQRDAVNLAVLWTASGALPRDYVARVSCELRDVGGERGGASKILTPLMKDDTRWQALKAQAEGFARLGHKVAARSGINSRAELAHRLKHESKLSKAYRANLASKHGVDSYVFENEQRRIARGR
jgi:hypothetical protein